MYIPLETTLQHHFRELTLKHVEPWIYLSTACVSVMSRRLTLGGSTAAMGRYREGPQCQSASSSSLLGACSPGRRPSTAMVACFVMLGLFVYLWHSASTSSSLSARGRSVRLGSKAAHEHSAIKQAAAQITADALPPDAHSKPFRRHHHGTRDHQSAAKARDHGPRRAAAVFPNKSSAIATTFPPPTRAPSTACCTDPRLVGVLRTVAASTPCPIQWVTGDPLVSLDSPTTTKAPSGAVADDDKVPYDRIVEYVRYDPPADIVALMPDNGRHGVREAANLHNQRGNVVVGGGTMLLFHGCSHDARDFCLRADVDRTGGAASSCPRHPQSPVRGKLGRKWTHVYPKCRALAEEMRIVAEALSIGLTVIAVSSMANSGCWNTFLGKNRVMNRDLSQVLRVLFREGIVTASDTAIMQKWLADEHRFALKSAGADIDDSGVASLGPDELARKYAHSLSQLRVDSSSRRGARGETTRFAYRYLTSAPIYAFGASSGGSFLGLLPAVLGTRLRGLVPQIANPHISLPEWPLRVVYSTMQRDGPMSREVAVRVASYNKPRLDKHMEQWACHVVRPAFNITADRLVHHVLGCTAAPGSDQCAAAQAADIAQVMSKLARTICPGSPTSEAASVGGAAAAQGKYDSTSHVPTHLCEPDGSLLGDPRRIDKGWRKALRLRLDSWGLRASGRPPVVANDVRDSDALFSLDAVLERDSLVADVSSLSEIVNVAYAQHEMSAEGITDAFYFITHLALHCPQL